MENVHLQVLTLKINYKQLVPSIKIDILPLTVMFNESLDPTSDAYFAFYFYFIPWFSFLIAEIRWLSLKLAGA